MTDDERLAQALAAQQQSVWADAPPWAIELGVTMLQILKQEKLNMAAIDDLNAAVTGLATGFTALDAAVQDEIRALTDALASAGGGIDPATTTAIQQAVANISAITASMAGDAARLTGSIPSVPTMNPPPAPNRDLPVPPDVDVPQINPLR